MPLNGYYRYDHPQCVPVADGSVRGPWAAALGATSCNGNDISLSSELSRFSLTLNLLFVFNLQRSNATAGAGRGRGGGARQRTADRSVGFKES